MQSPILIVSSSSINQSAKIQARLHEQNKCSVYWSVTYFGTNLMSKKCRLKYSERKTTKRDIIKQATKITLYETEGCVIFILEIF